jgi:hypothetical protein
MSNRFIAVILLIVCLLITIPPSVALAHEVATSGQMGVILHIEPDDNPAAGKQQSIVFYYNDLSENFNAYKCACQVIIGSKGKDSYTNTVVPDSALQGKTYYTFPSRGLYSINLKGKPLAAKDFAPFEVNFAVQVNRSAGGQDLSKKSVGRSAGVVSIIFGAGLLLLLAVSLCAYRLKAKHH